jgi:hypothetical protein
MAKKIEKKAVQITAPNMVTAEFRIVGNAPYVQAKFSFKAREMMRNKMLAGSVSSKGKKRPPRDFDDDYEQAKHISTDGWIGIPASCFRQAMISACRLVGFKMTLAKLSVFVESDGFDADGYPLIKIGGEPVKHEAMVRNATGVADIRVRPMWHDWSAKVRVRYDADQFSLEDVVNLFTRVGMQVGIGEGRPDSKASSGMGWGTFDITDVTGKAA